MKIALAQMNITDSLADNTASLIRLCRKAADQQADLVILPELWNTPFINPHILAHAQESTQLMELLSHLAANLHLWIIAGSLPVKEEGRLYNRCLVYDDSGRLVTTADKAHLLEVHTKKHVYRESDVFDAGEGLVSFASPWGTIALLICFDVRFPEAARLVCEHAFLLAVPAGFNASVGLKHWQPLLEARAIENEVYVIGVNGAARSYGQYDSYGHSMAVSPDGTLLMEMGMQEDLQCVEVDPALPERIRSRSPYLSLRRADLYSLEGK